MRKTSGESDDTESKVGLRGVFVPLVLVDMCEGNVYDALMLAQIVYWHEPARDGKVRLRIEHDGHMWIAKNHGDWWDECRINKATARKCLERLKARGLIVYELRGFAGAKTPHIRLNAQRYSDEVALRLAKDDHATPCSNGTHPLSYQDIPPATVGHAPVLSGHTPCPDVTYPLSWEVTPNTENTPETTTDSTPEITSESSSYARAREGAYAGEPITTTTKDAPANMQEILHENTSDDAAGSSAAPSGLLSSSGATAPPPGSAPPPSPAALAKDALWRAYAQAMGGADVPATAFKPHVDAWQALMDMGATADEVEAVTRASLKGRNLAERPYPFWFVPDDLKRWRRARRPAPNDASRYTTGRFGAFIQTGIETAQIGLGG